MNYDVGEATEGLENELWCKWNDGRGGEWGSAHSRTLPTSLHLRQGTSPTSPGESPLKLESMVCEICNCNKRFSVLSDIMEVSSKTYLAKYTIEMNNILRYFWKRLKYYELNKYPQLVSNTRSGRGMRCDEAPIYYRSVSSKGAGRPRLTHHHKGGWNETKCMRWVWRNGGMKFVVGENVRNPVKNLPRPLSSTTKPTWSDRDANSGPQRWEASALPLAPQGRHPLYIISLIWRQYKLNREKKRVIE